MKPDVDVGDPGKPLGAELREEDRPVLRGLRLPHVVAEGRSGGSFAGAIGLHQLRANRQGRASYVVVAPVLACFEAECYGVGGCSAFDGGRAGSRWARCPEVLGAELGHELVPQVMAGTGVDEAGVAVS